MCSVVTKLYVSFEELQLQSSCKDKPDLTVFWLLSYHLCVCLLLLLSQWIFCTVFWGFGVCRCA